MLAKPHRLSKAKDFAIIYKRGKPYFSDSLVFKFTPNHLNRTRFGFIVGNKISKKSSWRNKIKRRMREIIRAELPKIKSGCDCLFIARANIINRNYQEIKKEIVKLLRKSRILT